MARARDLGRTSSLSFRARREGCIYIYIYMYIDYIHWAAR